MEISRLKEKIIIEKNQVTIDGIGNHINAWSEYYTCRAYASTFTAQETDDEVVEHENRIILFSVRSCEKTKVLTSINYRVRFREQIYNIVSVDMLNYKGKEIKLRCKLEVRQ